MKVKDSLMKEAKVLLTRSAESIAVAKRSVSVSCSGCGAGCSGIVGD